MTNKMKLTIKKESEGVTVIAVLSAAGPELSFCLARSLEPLEAFQPDGPAAWTVRPVSMDFRVPMQEITLSGLTPGLVTVRYGGPLTGNYCANQENILAMSLYNGWYPTGPQGDVLEPAQVRLLLPRPWLVVNGEYSAAEDCWEYRSRDFDLNILAVNGYRSLENDRIAVRYPDQSFESAARLYFEGYSGVLDFCRGLFGSDRARERLTLLFLPPKEQLGAYRRTGLMVCSEPDDDPGEALHTLAHETAHAWCTGADFHCWEDWLNEAAAEWAALLFELSRGNRDRFDRVIAEKQRETGIVPPRLKTADGSRPDSMTVHNAGVLVLYELFRQYGKAAIEDLLRQFDRLERKTTADLLSALAAAGRAELSDSLSGYL